MSNELREAAQALLTCWDEAGCIGNDWIAETTELFERLRKALAAQSVTDSHQLASPVEPAAERPTTLEEMREIFRGKP